MKRETPRIKLPDNYEITSVSINGLEITDETSTADIYNHIGLPSVPVKVNLNGIIEVNIPDEKS